MGTNKLIRETCQMIEREGGKVMEVLEGPHIKLRFSTPHGPRTLTMSRTPSDHRAAVSNRSIVRRLMRGQR